MLVATPLLMGAALLSSASCPPLPRLGPLERRLCGVADCRRIGRLGTYQIGLIALLVWVIPLFLLIDRASVFLVFVALLVLTFGIEFTYGPQATLFASLSIAAYLIIVLRSLSARPSL